MIIRRVLATLAVAVGLGAGTGTMARAQESPAAQDEALDSLLEKLSDPSDRPGETSRKTVASAKEGQSAKKSDPAAKSRKPDGGKPQAGRTTTPGGGADAKGQKTPATKPDGVPALTGKDQEVDELLQKLGETTETPAPQERPGGGAGGEKPDDHKAGGKPDQPDRSRLSGKDKETDEHLEELTGRRKKKKADDDERSGPAGQIIKEMRDIEQKLGKPDTGEGTREEQKKVVKEIETLIEEMKKSGQGSMGRLVIRRVRRPGQQQQGGRQRGSTDGAMAQGAPLQKPKNPTTKHANVGGKDIWGHLPDEMRQEIENMFNEEPLSTRTELIKRYYNSVGARKLVREETP